MNLKKGMILLSVLLLFCLSFIIVVIAGFILFFDPSIGETTKTDPKALGNYNHYVENVLLSDLKGLLPSESTSDRNDQSYLYWYSGSLGGSQFCIALNSQFEDEAAFDAERARIEALSAHSEEISDEEKIYYIKGTAENISNLLDDEVFDGIHYQFEIAIVNSESQSVEYFTAYVIEGLMRTPFIEEFFNKV